MLSVVYEVLDRQKRPLRNHHYLAFPKAGLAFAKIPGAPFEAMRPVLEQLGGIDGTRHDALAADARGAHVWHGDTALLTARELKRRHPDFPVFTVIQSPAERLARCYEVLIQGPEPLPAFFAERRFDKSMPLAKFVEQVAVIPDMRADNLVRSQTAILSYRGRLVPDLVLEINRLEADWWRLEDLVQDRSGRTIISGPQAVPVPSPSTLARLQADDMTAAIARRYKADLARFFSVGRRTDERIQKSRPPEPGLTLPSSA
ncbi:MAG: hypothetical protein JJ902_12405 [Roseibium sp.]|nr:hypothetical protein [Roseibium sp.]